MISRPFIFSSYAQSFGAGILAALCLPHAGVTNFVFDFTPWNIPIFLAAIGVLYYHIIIPLKEGDARLDHFLIWKYFSPRLFLNAYLWAFGYFLIGLSWIGNALLIDTNPYAWAWPLAIAGLPAILALFLGLTFGYAGTLLKFQSTGLSSLTFAALFTLAEYARGHLFTGFSWNLPGMYWSETLTIFQSLSITGIYGLTFLTVWFAAYITHRLTTRHPRPPFGDIAAIILIVIILYFGIYRLSQPDAPTNTTQQIVMVQANIPQSERFNPDLTADHFYRHLALSERPPNLLDRPTLILWPETILPPSYIHARPIENAIQHLLATYPTGSALLTGAVTISGPDDAPSYGNGLIAYQNGHAAIDVYQKRHLVPFGEYIPYQKYIPLAPVARFENLTPGTGPSTVTIPGHTPFRPLICYESAFGGEVIAGLGAAHWIFALTNDAWYGNSPGPYQHFAESRARAIETERPVVRVAITGISGAIDAHGRILTTLPYGTSGQAPIIINIPEISAKTFYETFGDRPLLSIIALILGIGAFQKKRSIGTKRT